MKKALLSFMALIMFCSVSWANCCEDNKTIPLEPVDKNQSDCKKIDKCDACSIDDDEYCIYNECFFDKEYRKMKIELCLSKEQEIRIDNVYKNFKADLENVCAKYKNEKNKLLEMIACDDPCYKKQEGVVKKIRKEIKEKFKEFKDDVQEQLCKNQYFKYQKFMRCEKKKIKKIIKYGAIYKFPCVECCTK